MGALRRPPCQEQTGQVSVEAQAGHQSYLECALDPYGQARFPFDDPLDKCGSQDTVISDENAHEFLSLLEVQGIDYETQS
ncbi:hypothetical protein RvVAT039_pl05060 (plasmid) [Agrobacterium vitis]|nr:hypothetical protein RvVAT039_pl05060 [Agrobacterium vitis]